MVRAKFKVKSVTNMANGSEVNLTPVTQGSDENSEFFKWTPYGEIKLGLVKPEQAEQFKPDAEFYIDFIPAN